MTARQAPEPAAGGTRAPERVVTRPPDRSVMAADMPSEMEVEDYRMAGFSVSLSGDDGDALHGYWEKLSASGTTTMPLQKQVWGDEFGMCEDGFGVSWLVNISQPQA